MCVDKILSFLDLAFAQVLCEDVSLDKVKESFLKNISNDEHKAEKFLVNLSMVKMDLKKDLEFFMNSDPAIDSKEEVVLAYPGYKCIAYYRVAHILYELGFRLEARIVTEEAHKLTGIDIHPAAKIDVPFFIDHGTGIVIGETSIIGKNVKLYQGVTLGALSLSKGSKMKGIKRHPTILDNVVIYANASILGDVTIGKNVVIGSNVFITEDIKDNVKVVIGKPKLTVIKK